MKKKLILTILSLLMLSACWDLQEIEEIGFVMSVGLDPLDETDYKQYREQFKKETNQSPEQLFKSTFQVVIPGVLTELHAIEDVPFFNISTVGRTNFKSVRQIASRRSRRLNFEHLKALIINEELVRRGEIGKFIDFYIRDHEMRRTTLVYISNGDGSAILEEKLPLEIVPARSIMMIQNNFPAHHGMSHPTEIGDLSTRVLEEKSYIIPRITKDARNDLVIAGAGVFLGKTNELIGWLGEVDLEGYNLVRGEAENAIIEATLDDQLFVFEIDNMDSIVEYEHKNGEDQFHIEIKVAGFFVESWLEDVEIAEQEEIEKAEAALEEEIGKLTVKIIEKMQEEFHADIFDLYRTIQKKNYNRWKEVADDWDGEDGYFSKAIININPRARIRHYMTKEKLT